MKTPHKPHSDTTDIERSKPDALPEILTVEEVAEWLRVNRKTVYEAASRDEIPCRKIGRILRFSREAVVQWLTGQGRVSTRKRGGP